MFAVIKQVCYLPAAALGSGLYKTGEETASVFPACFFGFTSELTGTRGVPKKLSNPLAASSSFLVSGMEFN